MSDPQEPTVSLPPTARTDQAATQLVGGVSTPTGAAGEPAADVLPPELADHPRYRIIRLIGRGGMGAVYLAEHRMMGRQVALKMIHPKYMASPTAVERFRREVRAAAQLSHPNIVAAYDAEQAGSTNFLVMEYVEGQTLAEYLHHTGPLPVPEACDYALQVARALQFAHGKGMTHRDIKPDNLMRTPRGEVRVLDFGLARLAETADLKSAEPAPQAPGLTTAGTVMGTPDYMAPEQARDSSLADARSDIYALGATLFHLLTGTVPFPGGEAGEKLARHTAEPAPPVSAIREGVPPGLERLVGRMLAKRPEDRPQTPAEVARHLRRYARPTRLGWWLGGGAVAAMLSLVVGVLIWYFAIWPGRGWIEVNGAPPGRPFVVVGQDVNGTERRYQFVTGPRNHYSVTPGTYSLMWPRSSPEEFIPKGVKVVRGQTAVVHVMSPPPKP